MSDDRRGGDRAANGVRNQCYDEIRTAMKSELNQYYHHHPDWLLDDRSKEKLAMMSRVLSRVLTCLDKYDISIKSNLTD